MKKNKKNKKIYIVIPTLQGFHLREVNKKGEIIN